jgi:hypothetical protein
MTRKQRIRPIAPGALILPLRDKKQELLGCAMRVLGARSDRHDPLFQRSSVFPLNLDASPKA